MANKRNALLCAIGWWFVRRQMRRKLAGLGVATAPARGRRVLGALAVVGALAGAFVVWRRLSGDDGWGEPPLEPEAPAQPPPGSHAEA